VPVENSLQFAAALRAAHVPFEFHIYPHGRHGLGIGVQQYAPDAKLHPWAAECIRWLKEQGFAN
jgi:dipeptidyl aminopeptidase/acylaminoacyl peptidase